MAMPLTLEQWRLLSAMDDLASWLSTPYEQSFSFLAAIAAPRHQFVRYDALIDRVEYENPNVFYVTRESPSDSRWMVPGTFIE